MRIIKHPSPTEAVIEKIYSKEDLSTIEQEILKAKCKEIYIPGFRPGFAPLDKVREKLMASRDWEDLMGMKLQERIITDWSKEKDAELGEIVKILNVKSTKSDPLTLECHFEYFPRLSESDLSENYKQLKIKSDKKADDIKVSEKDVEEGLLELQKRRTILKPVSDALGKDKFAFIKKNSAEEKNVSADQKENKDLFQWGKEQYGKDFDKEVEGMKEGEEKKIGKEIIKVEKVFVSEAPEINDEFAKSLGHFHDLADLKSSIKQGMRMEKLHKELEARREAMIQSLLETVKIEVPGSIVERSAKSYKKDFENQLGKFGNVPDNNKNADKREKFNKIFEEKAKRELKLQRILEAIALKEKIVPSVEEVEKEIGRILKSFSKPKEAKDTLGSPAELRSRVTLSLCFDKTLRFLEKENNITSDIEEEISKLEEAHEREHKHHHHH